jgi:hypothetical protein
MSTNDSWSNEWVTFFDEYAGNFHPTFREKLAIQLFEKGSVETGIPGFEKYNFFLLVGQEYLEPKEFDGCMFVTVSFITPSSCSIPVRIYWGAKGKDINTLHTKNVSRINVEFHWGGNFPLEEVLPHIKPYKKEKKEKTGLYFDIEYYHSAFPDLFLEFVFAKPPVKKQIDEIDDILIDLVHKWNDKPRSLKIENIGNLIKKERTVYEVMADFGANTSIKAVGSLLKELSARLKPNVISTIKVK